MTRWAIVAYFLVELLFYTIALQNNTDVENTCTPTLYSQENEESFFIQRKWISQLFYEARTAFRMDPNVNTQCKEDFDLYTLHLNNQSMWAMRMMDSSEWPIRGILGGTVDYMGNYLDCLSISSYGIDGRYCLVEAKYQYYYPLRSEFVDAPDGSISVWEAVTMFEKNPSRIDRKKLTFAMCIPSSCKSTDLKISLESTVFPIFEPHRVSITIDVNPESCQTRKEFAYSTGFYIVSCFFIFLFLLVIWSTLYDIAKSDIVEVKKKDERKNQLFKDVSKVFSLVRNFRKFISISSKDNAALHFPKLINMLAVVGVHRLFVFGGTHPASNSYGVEKFYRGCISFILARDTPVDVFLFVSGFLMFHLELVNMIKGGKIHLFSIVVLRWIRVIPVFGVLILYVIYILPYTGDGPIWTSRIKNEADFCRESWWAAILAMGNFVKCDRSCLIHSWYIPVDVQLTIIGAILLFICSKHEKIGIVFTALLFIVSIVITFCNTYVNELNAVVGVHFESMKNLRMYRDFTQLYVSTISRCGSYLMGFICAYVVQVLKEKKIKFTSKQTYVLLLVFALVSEASQIYGSVFFTFNRPYDRLENALYAALNRILSVSFYVVFYCAYFTSGLGIFNKMVEWKIWIFWGRLLYSIFLLSTVIQLYHFASQKEPLPLSDHMNLWWWLFGDIIFIHLVALIFYLFVEAPILNLRTLVKVKLSMFYRKLEKLDEGMNNNTKFEETNGKKTT